MSELSYPIPFFNRLFGKTQGRSADIHPQGVRIGDTWVPHDADGAWRWHHQWFWDRVEFHRHSGAEVRFLLGRGSGVAFVAKACAMRLADAFGTEIAAATKHLERWARLVGADRYVPRHEVDEWVAEAQVIIAPLVPQLDSFRSFDPSGPVMRLAAEAKDAVASMALRNDTWVRRELARRAGWFAGLPKPPTATQQEIAVRDETNALVVAGAGTGKTATIITKIRYLVDAGVASPADILVLAFNADAAEEIRERCAEGGVAGVTVLTFHALGLGILASGPGERPPVLTEVATDESRTDLIGRLVENLLAEPEFAQNFAKFTALYTRPVVDRFASSTEADYASRAKATLRPAFSGAWVRSSEELRIANWLYAHGIAFEYERPFPFATAGEGRTRYRPDFTITLKQRRQDGTVGEVLVFLEHQALDEQGNPPPWMARYREKVAWAREAHRRHGTTLVESFSWWFQQGVWEEKLASALTRAGVPVRPVDWPSFLRRLESTEAPRIAADRRLVIELIRRVLDLSRAGGGPEAAATPGTPPRLATSLLGAVRRNLARLVHGYGAEAPPEPDRIKLFDAIFSAVQAAYEGHKRKRQGIDFEDMISLARQIVGQGAFRAPWSHYIIDEFQDASQSRLELVQLLRRQRRDSRLLCVGDDWQAIIRFAGGDIRVMTEFAQRIGPHWGAALEQTFRYSPVIAEISTEFVTANPSQLKKKIRPATDRRNLPIRIVLASPLESADAGSEEAGFNDVLAAELATIASLMPGASVMLLSRYRRGVPSKEEQQSIQRTFPHLHLAWSTVHRAKGGEADAVIVADLDNDEFGFPCRREDDPIIRRYLPPQDSFEHAEERRLLYVAMTRARHRLTLIASAAAPSPFVRELMERRGQRPGLEVVRSGEALKECPQCKVGVLLARDGTNGRFYSCSLSPACTYKEEACPTCRRGFLVAEGRHIVCSRTKKGDCTHRARLCPRCGQGWLVTRTNRQEGRDFLGCSRFTNEESQCRYTENL